MNTLLKFLMIFTIASVMIFGSFYLYLSAIFDTGPTYYKEDLIANYLEKSTSIQEVKNYFELISPKSKTIYIEFRGDEIEILKIKALEKQEESYSDLELDSEKMDSLRITLGWSRTMLETLKQKLEKANCISIENSHPVTIGWQRSGLGMYFYKIFDVQPNDSLISSYNNGCSFIYYKGNVVLEYGGGAIGPQCFP